MSGASHDPARPVGGSSLVADAEPLGAPAVGPGKRTLTEGLGPGPAKALPKEGGDGGQAATGPSTQVATGGGAVEQHDSPAPAPGVWPDAKPPPTGPAYAAGKHVTPTFSVTEVVGARSSSEPSLTDADTPTFTGHVALDGLNWRYQLDSVTSTGTITIVYYPESHYPAPTPMDDSGALSNVTAANWSAMVKDLKKHRTGMGGKWSAYRAEVLHEHYHWQVEWQGQVKKALTALETELAGMSVSAAKAGSIGEAEAALKPQVAAAFKKAMKAARDAYDALGDSPGDPPYIAQAPAIDALVKRIEDHAAAQKWPP
jgi:hypothetical protein